MVIKIIICNQSAFIKILVPSYTICAILGKLPSYPKSRLSNAYITEQ